MQFLDGYKTVTAGVGLVGLALYQASQGEWSLALQSFMAGLAALGIRHAIAKSAHPNLDGRG